VHRRAEAISMLYRPDGTNGRAVGDY
jgi:hypothetical protein